MTKKIIHKKDLKDCLDILTDESCNYKRTAIQVKKILELNDII